jgi:methyl-accepting chemotaxis protein
MIQIISKIRKSIVLKLVLTSVIGLTTIMLIASIIEYGVSSKRWRDNHEMVVSVNTQLLELSLPGALWNYQTDLINGILRSVVTSPEILATYIMEDGKVSKGFIQNQSGEAAESTEVPQGHPTITKQLFIKDNGDKPIAELIIVVSEAHLNDVLNDVRLLSLTRSIAMALILSIALLILIRQLVYKPLEHLTTALRNLNSSEGDLTKRITLNKQDEMGLLSQLFNDFIQKLQQAVSHIGGITQEMNDSAAALGELSQRSSMLVSSQQQEVELIATAANQSSAASEEVAMNTKNSLDAAGDASEGVTLARTAMGSLSDVNAQLDSVIKLANNAMESLNADVAEIGVVLDVIRGIADQTNLLALNAAIEAARAGEQGRGFAVVADEVRALAAKTADSTSEIREMIGRLQGSASAGTEATGKGLEVSSTSVAKVEEVGQSLERVFRSIEKINEMSAQIANATQEQASVTSEISVNAASLSNVSHQSAEGAAQSAKIAEHVSEQILNLKKASVQFKY